MTDWPPHPNDEWVDVTSYGDTVPQYMLGRSGCAAAVSEAREAYAMGHIDVDELERRIDLALRGEVLS